MDKFIINNAFKVEGEGGKFSLYRKMQFGRLRIGKGGVSISVKLVGFVDAEDAKGIPTFEEFAAAELTTIQHKTAA